MRITVCHILFATFLSFGGVGSADLEVQREKENVVASAIVGEWVPDDSVGQRLGTKNLGTLVIEDDPSALARIPEKLATLLDGRRIYLGGRMSLRGTEKASREHVFALIELHGNPYLLKFWSRGGKEIDDATSSIVMLARASEPKSDMLFLGGDFNNGPFRAWKRASE